MRHPFARLLLGLGVLSGGGWLLGEGLRTVLRHLGIAQNLLGNTALAALGEAEELTRVALPARRGRPELALGNIAGTVIHFATLNAGAIALVKPLTLDHDTTALLSAGRSREPCALRRSAPGKIDAWDVWRAQLCSPSMRRTSRPRW